MIAFMTDFYVHSRPTPNPSCHEIIDRHALRTVLHSAILYMTLACTPFRLDGSACVKEGPAKFLRLCLYARRGAGCRSVIRG